MLCAIYKCNKKQQAYLYVPGRDDFSRVPDALLETFGTPQFLMIMPLKKDRKLAQLDIETLRSELNKKGYYLQIPPTEEDLLKSHLKQNAQVGSK
jgi:uncharacterized protein YcgL (UPF0745 family)